MPILTPVSSAQAQNLVWNVDTLDWVAMTQPGGSAGGAVDQGAGGASAWLVTGPLTNTQLRAAAVPVDGSGVTQPVSGTVGVSGNVAVTGTFYPETQPVSLASMPTTPVTGTFWQATQPVSLAAAPTTPVTGTFWQATQPVSLSSLPSLAAGSANIGDVDVLTLPALATGAAIIGRVGIDQTTPGTTNKVSIGSDGVIASITAAVPVTDNSGSLTIDAPVGTPVFTRLSDGAAALVGQKAMTASLPVVIASNQSAVPVSMASASVLFKGRACTFRTPGRAGTAGQNILSLHNATGSAVVVTVNKIFVDVYQTVVKAVTVAPPIVRVWKVTVLPTNGSTLAKTQIGGTSTSNASVTVRGDASADGSGSGTTLTATRPAGTFIAQQTASRLITAASYENADVIEFFTDSTVALQALEGLVVFLDYTLATQNPVTDMWIAGIEWTEV